MINLKKEYIYQATLLTNECLSRYWQGDYQFVLEHICDDAMWIGALQKEFMQGKDNIKADFEITVKEIVKCHLINAEFYVADTTRESCLVAGNYIVQTDGNEEVFLSTCQRCVFEWKLINAELKIKLIYVSNPIDEIKIAENERFPNRLGKATLEYVNKEIKKRVNSSRKLCVYDENNYLHFIYIDEINYAEANFRNVCIHLKDKTIVAKIKWNDFLKEVGDTLIKIHRSYAVNPRYVSVYNRKWFKLEDGNILYIAAKKQKQVKETIENMFDVKK